jgi:gluconolactonase
METQVLDPKFHLIIPRDSKVHQVVTGFEFVEGPIWHPYERSLIFSDILGNSIFRWSQESGLETLRRNSYMANGNTYDLEGRVVTCEHASSRLTRTDFSKCGRPEILVTHYQGKRLNSPNDVVCRSDGTLYFTDPNSGRSEGYGVPREQDLGFQGVYRLDPRDLSLVLLVDDFSKPNGLCFSQDESRLFIDDSDFDHIRVFDVNAEGTLCNGRLWAELNREGIGVADGMKVDRAGNLYCTGPGGIHLFDNEAHYLGIIQLPEQATNLAWGDSDLSSLYVTAVTSIYRLRTLVPGFAIL